MSAILTLLKNLPLILGLIESIEAGIEAGETDAKVADHLTAVKDAFDKQDATALNTVFNS